MQNAIGPEGAEGKRESYIVGHVFLSAICPSPSNHHIAHIAARQDQRFVVQRVLSRFPLNCQIADFETPARA